MSTATAWRLQGRYGSEVDITRLPRRWILQAKCNVGEWPLQTGGGRSGLASPQTAIADTRHWRTRAANRRDWPKAALIAALPLQGLAQKRINWRRLLAIRLARL